MSQTHTTLCQLWFPGGPEGVAWHRRPPPPPPGAMGCTYSEEADATGMKMVTAVPVLASPEDPAVVGAQLPVDTSFENLHAELCVDMGRAIASCSRACPKTAW